MKLLDKEFELYQKVAIPIESEFFDWLKHSNELSEILKKYTSSITALFRAVYTKFDVHYTIDVQGKEYRGKLDTRIFQYLRNYPISEAVITDDEKKAISDIIARDRIHNASGLSIEIVNKIDWLPGTYCEEKYSCWWDGGTDRPNLEWAMVQNQAFAIRIYKFDEPCGRCWGALLEDGFALFNFYAKGLSEDDFAKALAQFLDCDWNWREFDTRTTMYINGAEAIIFVPKGTEFEHSYYADFPTYHFDDPDIEKRRFMKYPEHELENCPNCGLIRPRGNIYVINPHGRSCLDCNRDSTIEYSYASNQYYDMRYYRRVAGKTRYEYDTYVLIEDEDAEDD